MGLIVLAQMVQLCALCLFHLPFSNFEQGWSLLHGLPLVHILLHMLSTQAVCISVTWNCSESSCCGCIYKLQRLILLFTIFAMIVCSSNISLQNPTSYTIFLQKSTPFGLSTSSQPLAKAGVHLCTKCAPTQCVYMTS
jgi:hypothetical protein